jgi:hypothetical protein
MKNAAEIRMLTDAELVAALIREEGTHADE